MKCFYKGGNVRNLFQKPFQIKNRKSSVPPLSWSKNRKSPHIEPLEIRAFTKFAFAELTLGTEVFIQDLIDWDTNMRLSRPRRSYGSPAIGRAHNA